MHVTLVHVRVKPDHIDAFIAAMMAEPRRGEAMRGLLPSD